MPMPTLPIKNFVRSLIRRSPGVDFALRGLYIASQFHPVSSSDLARVGEQLSGSWKDDGIPGRQRALVDVQLAAYRGGQSNPTFDGLVDILVHNISALDGKSLLEIGCSSGYHLEVLQCRDVDASYQGCDISPAFIQLARQTYPSTRFDVEDATQLSYGSCTFDIVVSGCCLLHIPDHEKAIAEAARVSREFVIFHRTPVLHLAGPAFYTKRAYGVEMVEIHFNEQQLVRMFVAHGLHVVDINSHHSMPERRQSDLLVYKTYLCRKVK
jgi:SAM-dependent methyltransferase